MLAAERADRTGLAVFDDGELRDLFADEAGKRPDSKAIWHVLRLAVKSGLVMPDPTTEEIRLDLAMIQPEGFPEVGAVYGDLTLVREVAAGTWLCKCACGSARTFRIEYLTTGITSRCNNASKHRPVA